MKTNWNCVDLLKGQAPIATVLLMHMPAEHAFWSLVAICDHYLPGYFSPGLEAIQLHGDMLFAFLKRFSPNAHKLMVFWIKLLRISFNYNLILISLNRKTKRLNPFYIWQNGLCVYSPEHFPGLRFYTFGICFYAKVFQIFSIFSIQSFLWLIFSSILSKGIKIVFKVAIEIISTRLKDENKKTCPTMYETLQKLRNIPKENLSESILVDHILKIELHDRDLQREHNVQEKNRRKAKISTNNKNK